ncbi:MAG: hypothetical protein U0136_13890 [Bdellovibrionota bacterium]
MEFRLVRELGEVLERLAEIFAERDLGYIPVFDLSTLTQYFEEATRGLPEEDDDVGWDAWCETRWSELGLPEDASRIETLSQHIAEHILDEERRHRQHRFLVSTTFGMN